MTEFKKGDKVRMLEDYADLKMGDIVVVDRAHRSKDPDSDDWVIYGSGHAFFSSRCKLVTEPIGPVTIETVKRINPGVYGRISIKVQGSDEPRLLIALAGISGTVDMMHHGWSLEELSEAITNLTAIRDALEGK